MTQSNRPFTIGIDLDLTSVDTGRGWYEWLCRHFEQIEELPEGNIDYNLGKYFSPGTTGLTHFDYWDNNHLYDDLYLIKGAEETFQEWKRKGYRLIFISHTKSGHFKSKFRMLKKMPFLKFGDGSSDAFVATKEKGLLSDAVDVMIDDRIDMLNQFSDKVVKIQFETPYTQKETPRTTFDLVTDEWSDIRDFVEEISFVKAVE